MLGLTDFLESPKEVYFENQETGENIILLLRAHLITLLPAVVFVFIFALAPLIFVEVNFILKLGFLNTLSNSLVLILFFVYYLSVAFFAFLKFLLWYFNIYLLTNQRIIDFDFYGFLYKSISETQLEKVQDVTSKISGPSQTFFNYGNVYIQTASEKPMFVFENISKPDLVEKQITDELRLGNHPASQNGV